MRIACLQFAPQVGRVSDNIARADAILSKADPEELDGLDLLVLPELAFSGYNFKSSEHISPYLEPTGSGVSAQWARASASKYGCTVAVGYPEKAEATGAGPECYVGLIVVDSKGEKLANYRKSFLFYTDDLWAREGQGFYGGRLGSLGQVALGICMDINPYKFEAPWDAYEFAFHILQVRANLVILSSAWLTNDEQTAFLSRSDAPDLSTLSYWLKRLEPVIKADNSEETIVVFANRCGTEDEATYAGTSTVMGIKDGEVSIYGMLGRGIEELLVVDTDKPPFAKVIKPANDSTDRESESPPAPAEDSEDSEDGPPSPPKPKTNFDSTDSPTLPATFTPSSRTYTATSNGQTHNTTKLTSPPSATTTKPQTTVTPTTPPTNTRPKLSLLTNLHPPLPPSQSPRTFQPLPLSPLSLSPPAPHHHRYQEPQYTWQHHNPPSSLPIVVDVYTPDADTETYIYTDDEAARLWHDNLAVDLNTDGGLLSPWSGSSAGGGKMIRIAASPSVFGGLGGMGRVMA